MTTKTISIAVLAALAVSLGACFLCADEGCDETACADCHCACAFFCIAPYDGSFALGLIPCGAINPYRHAGAFPELAFDLDRPPRAVLL